MKWWIHRQQVFLYMKSGFKVKRRQKKRVKSREKNFKFLFMHFYWGGKNFICFMLIFLNLKSKASHLFFWVASSLSILCEFTWVWVDKKRLNFRNQASISKIEVIRKSEWLNWLLTSNFGDFWPNFKSLQVKKSYLTNKNVLEKICILLAVQQSAPKVWWNYNKVHCYYR